MRRTPLAALVILALACDNGDVGEVRIERSELHRVVMKADYDAVLLGTDENTIKASLGEPEKLTRSSVTVLRYRVWDGERLGFFRMLFASGPPRGRQLFGDLHLEQGRLVSKRLTPVPGDPFARHSTSSN